MSRHRGAVALVVLAQWLGTSLWFSPSGASAGLMAQLGIGAAAFGWLIAATQLGFIAGTLAFAATGTADRFRASRIFAASSVVGALANAALVAPGLGYDAVWALRFGVGLCLAGIYPLGMKMIVQWVGGKPAAALGWLVGMLTLGTAMPHGLRAAGASWSWETIVLASSVLAVIGALLIYFLGDGPHGAARGNVNNSAPSGARAPSERAARAVFAIPGFRASAFGYFGHMWELYAFWSVLPLLCQPVSAELARRAGGSAAFGSVALLSFAVIAVGCIGCIAGGQASRRFGSAPVAAAALAGSGLMCLLYPLIPEQALALRLAALFFWGFCVVADSPQFSALAAQYAPPQWLGSALVAQNGIGFLITVASILILSRAVPAWGASAMWILAPGPILGLWALRPLLGRATRQNTSP
ncbi:MAG TPA: MFS transporter [Burkholderiaceae bacterium]